MPGADRNAWYLKLSVQIKSPGHDGDGVSAVVAELHTEEAVPSYSGLRALPCLGVDITTAECS